MDFTDQAMFDAGVDGSFDSQLFDVSQGFTAVNDPIETESTQTVSPNDIFLDPSNPSSTAFTNLTTPSMYDGSPDELNSLETSPMFDSLDEPNGNSWYSLFPDQDTASPKVQSNNTSSPAANATAMSRTVSLDNSTTNLHRLSVTSGIQKHRRTVKTLGPIEVDADDSTAVKRAKNTLAARKSRQKKRDIEDTLRTQVEALMVERDMWRDRAIARGHPVPEA